MDKTPLNNDDTTIYLSDEIIRDIFGYDSPEQFYKEVLLPNGVEGLDYKEVTDDHVLVQDPASSLKKARQLLKKSQIE